MAKRKPKIYGTSMNYGTTNHCPYGNTISTGVYIYGLRAGGFVDTKKMVFMK